MFDKLLESQSHTFDVTGRLKQAYTAMTTKSPDQCYTHVKLLLRFESAACSTTLVDLDIDDYDCYGDWSWEDPDEPVLNLKLKEMGLNDKQSKAVVIGLFENFEMSFEGSGLIASPCEGYFLHLTESDCVTWGAV